MPRKFFDTPNAKHVYTAIGIRNSLNPESQSKVIDFSYGIKRMNAATETANGKANSKKSVFPTGEVSTWHVPKAAANRIVIGKHLDRIPEGSVQDIEHIVENIKVTKGENGKPDTHAMLVAGNCLQARKINITSNEPFLHKKGDKIPAGKIVDYLMARKK